MSTQFGRLFNRSGIGPLTDFFGEQVTYVAKDGTERSIMAIIDRDVEVFEQVPVRADIVRVKNSVTLGISSTEINTGGDKLKYAKRDGDEPETFRISKVLSSDNGVVQFQMK